jgi:uncharacterized protein DUF5666
MRSTFAALALAAVSLACWPVSAGAAQDTKVARGTISALGGASITIKTADHDMTFKVDSKTFVQARGASTKAGRAAAAGKPGVHLEELLKTGQTVAVTYSEVAGALQAREIKAIASAAATTGTAEAEMRSVGVVKSIGADSLTVTGSGGGGASFVQTFKIDGATKVLAKGAGTAVAAKGGKAPFAELVSSGDHVSVAYHKVGDALIATDVRVTAKASH